jgi:Cu-Zn family superoxide dismutase
MSYSFISAVAVFDSSVKGTVRFTEYEHEVVISVDIKGLRPNSKHGFHVHECGDMTDKCESMCAHFNPYGKQHGGPGDKERHVGDLGNLVADKNGRAKYVQRDTMIKLRGTKCNIIGRGLIIHEDEDDLGRGGQKDSLVTGHAGKRIACAVIGYARP